MATARGQRWMLLVDAAQPAEQMGIAAQLGEVEQLREICFKIGEEVTSHAAIAACRAGSQNGRESLDTSIKNVTKSKLGLLGAPRLWREILGEDQPGLQRMTYRGQIAEETAEND
jgi:hypothetical protein